jgi:hypothetical protein
MCDKKNQLNLSEWLRRKNNQWIWYRTDIDMEIFRNDLYYHHADYRPMVNYKRKTNAEYISSLWRTDENLY